MARIRSKNTKPELLLRRALWAEGCRYRLHHNLPGRPDLVFLRDRLAIFVDGCFWHGCPLHYSAPRTRENFWKDKLRKNVTRDLAADDALIEQGWRVLRFWEHDLKDMEDVVRQIFDILHGKPKTWGTDTLPDMNVAESAAVYGTTDNDESSRQVCVCGSTDLRILSVNGHGSIRPNASHRPESVELICRKCRHIWSCKL